MTQILHRRYGIPANAKTSLEEAWRLAQAHTFVRTDYEGQAKLYKWSDEHSKFELTPHWAYWFARNVITDHWPLAEGFIRQDPEAWKAYSAYKQLCRELGLINYSVDGSPDFYVDSEGLITGWKEGRKPVKWEGLPPPTETFEQVADRIAENVAVFKQRKKLQSLLPEDDDES